MFQTEGHFFKVIFKRDLLYCDKSDIADVVNVVIDVVKENQAAAKQTFEVCSHFAGKPRNGCFDFCAARQTYVLNWFV